MALSFDDKGLPVCCGIGLVPGVPHTACPLCSAHYDTDKLATKIQGLQRAGRMARESALSASGPG